MAGDLELQDNVAYNKTTLTTTSKGAANYPHYEDVIIGRQAIRGARQTKEKEPFYDKVMDVRGTGKVPAAAGDDHEYEEPEPHYEEPV